MAVITRIRKRVGLLIGFVGVSMILFILGDLVTSNSGLLQGNSDVVGVIGDEKVHYQEYNRRVETLTENYKINTKNENVDQNTQDMLREQAWGMFVTDNTTGREIKKLGLTCSAGELYDMCVGTNPHPQIKQAFTDPKTGVFDPANVIKFLKDLPNRDENTQRQWKTFEDAIAEERIGTKYKDLIKAGLFVTGEEAKRNFEEAQKNASIRFARLDLNTIPDSSVKVEDSDLSSYYNANQQKYKQAETIRKVEYITFDVNPSPEDRAAVLASIQNLGKEYAATSDNLSFVSQNTDGAVDTTYHAKGTLPVMVDTALFNAAIGTIVGPYEEGNSVKVSKLTGEKVVSDSVKARHILINIMDGDSTKAMATADSLKNAVKKGAKFADLAMMFSKDQGSAIKGGDLGWFRQGMMVPTFNDACFNGKKGDMPIVTSQFGIHLIEILDKSAGSKQVQVLTLERKIEPSQRTYDAAYNKANEFASKNSTGEAFDSAIVKQGLNKRIADNIRENDKNIPGLDQPRELVRWAYTAKKGELSKIFTFGDKYVMAHLVGIKEKGTLPLDEVKDAVTVEARKIKKAQMLLDKFNAAGSGNVDAIAQKLNVTATDADNVNFANSYIPGMGNEPAMVGTIFAMKAGQTSKAIKGENSVAVIMVKSFTTPPATTDFSANIKQLQDQRKSRSDYEVQNTLKEKANIADNRAKFY
ncbi:MAG TPA: peptidylprolyl isomerase [Bacteroidia bacterium]|nr:peptidylprolyl isomerase [Bacteroidota bacterium]MBK7571891.1 peptidylprolyl isomerase [Bacteroidota bacterium]HQV99539.1 peptidylprolyl isomerase [Bacteroidia bacterium]